MLGIPYFPNVTTIDPRCSGLITRALPPLPACEICGEDIAEKFHMGARRCDTHENVELDRWAA